jgi:hypothetical protein
MNKKVYLAGQFSKFDKWKSVIARTPGFDFFDPETDSDQSTPETFYPDDLKAVQSADILIASPGKSPCEGTWIEVGYFIASHTNSPGDFCENLIIIWPEDRIDWSLEFVKKTGRVVTTVSDAIEALKVVH